MDPEKLPLENLAVSYFSFLAQTFPIQCASDEFTAFPRAREAMGHLDRVDDFSVRSREYAVGRVRDFQSEFHSIKPGCQDPDRAADLALAKISCSAVLSELESEKSHQSNPLLYLKTAFIGLDHALHKPAPKTKDAWERARARLEATPRLFAQGAENLQAVPARLQKASLAMAGDCGKYLNEVMDELPGPGRRALGASAEKTSRSLKDFTRFLQNLAPAPEKQAGPSQFRERVKHHFGSTKSAEEIFAIGDDERNQSLSRLRTLAKEIEPSRNWREIYHGFSPKTGQNPDVFSLYAHQARKLKGFFRDRGLHTGQPMEVALTPGYLLSVRSSASFAAALTKNPEEASYFYITPAFGDAGERAANRQLAARLARECLFLTAHETIPGHHYLDSFRRGLKNPIRSQVENPLFYEGWAYWAEGLLEKFGMVSDPRLLLVDARRNLWRAVRCMIDAGRAAGLLDEKQSRDLLVESGFSLGEAQRQVARFALNPGYQVCYSLGRRELENLATRHVPGMGLDGFHKALLQCGQAPFEAVAAVLDARDKERRNK